MPQGITAAAGVIFFAYIGFDAVTTGSEESKNPSRDLPIAVVGSLLISTVLYVLVAIAASACPDRHARRAATPRWPPRCARARACLGRRRCWPSAR